MTAWHAPTTAERPDAHSRLTVTPATVSGRPASSAAKRATLRLSSPAWLAHPSQTSSISSGRDAGPLDGGGDGDGGEVVGPHLGEPAAVASDGRPHRGEDHRATHPAPSASSSSKTPCAIANAPFAAGTPQ